MSSRPTWLYSKSQTTPPQKVLYKENEMMPVYEFMISKASWYFSVTSLLIILYYNLMFYFYCIFLLPLLRCQVTSSPVIPFLYFMVLTVLTKLTDQYFLNNTCKFFNCIPSMSARIQLYCIQKGIQLGSTYRGALQYILL